MPDTSAGIMEVCTVVDMMVIIAAVLFTMVAADTHKCCAGNGTGAAADAAGLYGLGSCCACLTPPSSLVGEVSEFLSDDHQRRLPVTLLRAARPVRCAYCEGREHPRISPLPPLVHSLNPSRAACWGLLACLCADRMC